MPPMLPRGRGAHGLAGFSPRATNSAAAGRNRLYALFPCEYAHQACGIAGMRKPGAWATGWNDLMTASSGDLNFDPGGPILEPGGGA